MESAAHILKELKISQGWLAEGLGVSRTAVTLLLNKGQWPKRAHRSGLLERLRERLEEGGAGAGDIERIEALLTSSTAEAAMHHSFTLLKKGVCMLPQIVLDRAGLERDPFTNELRGVQDVFGSRPHDFVLNKMLDAAAHQKFLGIYGPVGSGKTVMKNVFLETLRKEKNYMVSEPIMIERAKCRPGSLCDAMVEDFMYGFGGISSLGKMRSPRSLEGKNRLVRAILTNHSEQGRRAVLIIDEAHELPLDTLKALKRFHEHQNGFRKMLSIIIIGQEELFHGLNKDYRVREVTARIDLVELQPMRNVVKNYLSFKIDKAGGDVNALFDGEALDMIERKLEHPSPLLINVLASHSLMTAYAQDRLPATGAMVEEAYRKMAS